MRNKKSTAMSFRLNLSLPEEWRATLDLVARVKGLEVTELVRRLVHDCYVKGDIRQVCEREIDRIQVELAKVQTNEEAK